MLKTTARLSRMTTLSLLFWALTPSAHSAEPLAAFEATYKLDWDGSISLNGDSIRKLSPAADNSWTFDAKASALFASIQESSQFRWNNGTPEPLRYEFKRSVMGKKRKAEVEFDWGSQQVTNIVEDKPWQMAINPGVQDKISYQLLLQQEVAQGKKEFAYSVADGGKLKTYRFEVDGQEQVEAPIGTYNAIRVVRVREEDNPRQTAIWFAPELDYQIIKLEQVEKKDKSYTLLLKSLKK